MGEFHGDFPKNTNGVSKRGSPSVLPKRYSIRIDGFTGDFPTGVDGSLYAVSRISFRTDGEKPPKPEKKKAASGKSKGKKGKKGKK